MDVLFDREMPSVGFQRGSEFIGECAKNPKCFAIYLDEPSSRIRFWFSEKHYIRQQISSSSFVSDIYYLHKHNFTLSELYIMKNFQFGKGLGPLQSLEEYGVNKAKTENEELCEVFEKQFIEAEKNKLTKERQDFDAKNEIIDFKESIIHWKKEKHALERELAKYKNMVSNCQKEIESYFG